jgi:hypothetical protein
MKVAAFSVSIHVVDLWTYERVDANFDSRYAYIC